MSSPASARSSNSAFRRLHHQVSVEHALGDRSQRSDDHRTDREWGDEVRIHDVDMDDFGIRLDQLDLVGQVREVCGQDRSGEHAHRGYRTRPVRAAFAEGRDEHAVGTVSVRPQPHARRRAVRTVDRHGLQFGSMSDERVARRVRLRPRERAHRVDEAPAGTEPVGRRRCDAPPGAARGRRARPAAAARAAPAAGALTRCRSTARPPAPGRTSRRSPDACRPAPRRASGRGAVPRCSARGPPVRGGRRRRPRVRSRRPGIRRAPPCRPVPRRRRARGRPVADRARGRRTPTPGPARRTSPARSRAERAGSPPSRSTQSGWSCAGRGV